MDTKDLDVVYFVKDGLHNEEFRYSLRSVCLNLPHKRVWVFGGCPTNIVPDIRVRVAQSGKTKWDRVRNMFLTACENKEVSDDFVLFNDDFFVMKPVTEIKPYYRCTLDKHISLLESKYLNRSNEYTRLLRRCRDNLTKRGITPLSYELHIPFIFNKNKLLQMLNTFPEQHCTRTMYGNLYGVGGERVNDVKVFSIKPGFDYRTSTFLSTDDSVVNVNNDIWRYLQKQFPHKSEYEL